MNRKIILGLGSASDWLIRDQHGKVYSADEARSLWESGRVFDFNLAFQRLVQHGFDIEAVKQSYRSPHPSSLRPHPSPEAG